MQLQHLQAHFAIFAALVCALLLSGCGSAPVQGTFASSLSEYTIEQGRAVTVSAAAQNIGVQSIIIEFGEEKNTLSCQSATECSVSASFFPSSGVYLVKSFALSASGEIVAQDSQRLVVTSARANACTDSTPFGKCSSKKPMYCETGKLIEKCSECGCDAGYYCSENKCSAYAGTVTLGVVTYPSVVESDKTFSLRAIVKFSEGSVAGAMYEAVVKSGGVNFSKRFSQLESGNSEQAVEIGNISLPKGTHGIELTIYALNSGREVAGGYSAQNAINSQPIIEPPDAPSLDYALQEGDDISLGWSDETGAATYRIYKSFESNPAYVAYRLEKEVDAAQNSAVITGLANGTHFFAVSAVDAFGNESGYSNVKSVTIG